MLLLLSTHIVLLVVTLYAAFPISFFLSDPSASDWILSSFARRRFTRGNMILAMSERESRTNKSVATSEVQKLVCVEVGFEPDCELKFFECRRSLSRSFALSLPASVNTLCGARACSPLVSYYGGTARTRTCDLI